MPFEQRHDLFAEALTGINDSLWGATYVFSPEPLHDLPDKEEPGLEDEQQASLRRLERWLCELLIKNQQLRNSLELIRSLEREEDHDRSAKSR